MPPRSGPGSNLHLPIQGLSFSMTSTLSTPRSRATTTTTRPRSRSTTSARRRTSWPPSTRPSSTSTTATSSTAPSSRWTVTRSCSTSATRPRASSPSRELSIKHDVDPSEVVQVGDKVEALVLQKEDKEGRLILSKKRAQYERAWGTIEEIKEADGVVEGTVIEVVKGGLIIDIGSGGASSPRRSSRCAGSATCSRTSARRSRRRSSSSTRTATTCPVAPRLARADAVRGSPRLPHPAPEGPDSQGCRVLDRQLRCVRGPRRRRRSRPRLGAVLEAHRPPVRGRHRR